MNKLPECERPSVSLLACTTRHSTAQEVSGLSPLARGLPGRRPHPRLRHRIIPARAGFTSCSPAPRRCRADHPRSRGVYAGEGEELLRTTGSSPLARGLLINSIDRAIWRGIIPARAGFTHALEVLVRVWGDHPRSRGVYRHPIVRTRRSEGSSPLARGLRIHYSARGARARIIPARAGFTSWPPRLRSSSADHPRSRGVYVDVSSYQAGISGSSPLARGLPCFGSLASKSDRIIPARAGFTEIWKSAIPVHPDHPRSRGVYLKCGSALMVSGGSSPLARGLLAKTLQLLRSIRIIPARAGFTCPRK